MNIWLFGEIFFILVLTLCLFLYSEKAKLSKKYIFIFTFILLIVLLNVLLVDFHSIKIVIFFYLIYLSYTFPSAAAKLFLLILIVLTTIDIYINGYDSKLSAIPFILIFSLLPYIIGIKRNSSIKLRMFFLIFVILELAQGILFDYRGSIIAGLFALLFLAATVKYRRRLVKIFCFFPVIHIVGMSSFLFLLALGYDLPLTLSNIERSSMVSWGVSNFMDYLLIGPGQSVFQTYAGELKTLYGFTDNIPSDPHSFIFQIFIFGGGSLAIVSYVFLVTKIIKINRIIEPQFHYYLFAVLPLFITFTLHPFSADSRLVVAVSFGLILSLLKGSKLNQSKALV
jgi:hypothetical protein